MRKNTEELILAIERFELDSKLDQMDINKVVCNLYNYIETLKYIERRFFFKNRVLYSDFSFSKFEDWYCDNPNIQTYEATLQSLSTRASFSEYRRERRRILRLCKDIYKLVLHI